MAINKRWLALVLTVAMTLMGMSMSADASSLDNQFLSKINASRSSAGLAPLTMSGSLQNYATSHSAKMGADGGIYHSSSAQLRAAAGSGWTKLGENVGRGPNVDALHTAFMNSAGHKKNILGDYNYVGIGTATVDGYIYVTAVFMKKGSGSSTTPTTAAPTATTPKAKKVEAAPTTTTTTIPPTTTTTLIVPPDKEVTPGNECIQANRFWQMCHD